MDSALPGDLTLRRRIERAVRVDHAGEYGARRIYDGQLFILGKKPAARVIRHMAEQEKAHLAEFTRQLVARRVRPTALMPLWHVCGFALGAGTALLGEKAAMACTAAVETVIDEHYARQEAELGQQEPELRETIARFRADEKEHHDTAVEHGAHQSPLYALLTAAVTAQTKLAIWLSTRI